MSDLLPEGVDDLLDLPFTLAGAIRSALLFLSFDELPREERPPKSIWLDGRRLQEWFDEVRRDRNRELDGKPVDDPVENAAAESLLVG